MEETDVKEQTGHIDEDGNIVPDVVPEEGNAETPESSTETEAGSETPAEGENTEEEPQEVTVEGLSDEQFNKVVAELTKEGQPYHKNSGFQRIIGQRDSSRKRSEAIFMKLAKSNPEVAKELLMDEGQTEEEAALTLKKMDISLDKPIPEKVTAGTEGVDEIQLIQILKGMGYDYASMTPEQRDFWKFQYALMTKQTETQYKPFKEFMEKSKKEREQEQNTAREQEFLKSLGDLKKSVKDVYGIDWTENNDTKMTAYLDAHPKFMGNVEELFFLAHKDQLIEMGKLAQNKETAELNEDKRKMNTEKPGSSGKADTLPDHVGPGKSMAATFEYLNKKHGG